MTIYVLLSQSEMERRQVMSEKKSGFVTIVGRPNVGKSTLMNKMIGQKIAITSNKPQTTRNKIKTLYTDDRGQIVFLDTPGIHRSQNKLGEYMVTAAKKTLSEVDVILWLVEPSTYIGVMEQQIAEYIRYSKKPVILVINKVDTCVREDIFKYIDAYKDILDFSAIVPISARTGINVDTLMEEMFKLLPYGPMYYDEDTVTDIPMRDIASEIIREKALHALSDEVPHGIAVEMISMKERADGSLWDIEADIICEKDSHKGIIIGKGGAMLKKIGTNARYEIEKLVEGKVNLKLFVKVRKEWRDNEGLLKNYGYDRNKL